MARSPMISSRWPRPSANSVSITTKPGLDGLDHQIPVDDRGRRPLDRHLTLRRRSAPCRRAGAQADRRRGRATPVPPARGRHRRFRQRCRRPRLPRRRPTAHNLSCRVRGTCAKPNCPFSNRNSSIEPDVGQSGDERDAVADLLDTADLFRLWRQSGVGQAVLAPSSHRSASALWLCVMRESGQDFGEIGAPTVADHEMGRAQFEAGDERGIDLEDHAARRAESLANLTRGARLFGRIERGRARRLQGGRLLGGGSRARRPAMRGWRQAPSRETRRGWSGRPTAQPVAWRYRPPGRTIAATSSGSPRPFRPRPPLLRSQQGPRLRPWPPSSTPRRSAPTRARASASIF